MQQTLPTMPMQQRHPNFQLRNHRLRLRALCLLDSLRVKDRFSTLTARDRTTEIQQQRPSRFGRHRDRFRPRRRIIGVGLWYLDREEKIVAFVVVFIEELAWRVAVDPDVRVQAQQVPAPESGRLLCCQRGVVDRRVAQERR